MNYLDLLKIIPIALIALFFLTEEDMTESVKDTCVYLFIYLILFLMVYLSCMNKKKHRFVVIVIAIILYIVFILFSKKFI